MAENDKDIVQKLFDEVSARTGIPRIDLSDNDSAALPFGESVQCMSVNSNGTTTVSKYGFTVERQKGEEIWSD